MSKQIVDQKKKEVVDCGEYIKVRKYCCLFKRFILGTKVEYDRYDKYSIRIKTINPSEGVSVTGFEYEDDAMEVAIYIMDVCQSDTKKLI
jgi:hypothetical protein